ncbi:MAG: hypothetical protein K8I30_11695, partial [Anaerolineae bacterium]|nr:hypothetical protein [Anaerolineae bacterium]
MIFRLAIVLLGLSLLAPVAAEPEGEVNTALALEQAVIPVRDRVDLARRLLDVTAIAPAPASAPEHTIGDQDAFWITNTFENQAFPVDTSLRTVGDWIYLWVENGVEISPRALQALADGFDNEIYQRMRDLWGSENTPGIDGDPRVYGVFAF